MKISNETKIGALTAVAIVLLILGYNYLKGKDLFEHTKKIYAIFKNVEGLEASNAVTIRGLQVGTVYAINATDKNVDGIQVTISMKKDVNIPKNSIAVISTGLISGANLEIHKGDATEYLQDEDTMSTTEKPNLLSQVQTNLNPVITRLSGTLGSLDSLIKVVGSLFDPTVKNNFGSIIANLAKSSASLQIMLNEKTGALAHSLNHVDSFTRNLSNNNAMVTSTLSNLDKTSAKLANAKIDETLQSAQTAMNELKEAINKINSPNGSLGLLVNDKKLYNNLEYTTRSLNTLLDDVRIHPKRYVSISVFGKKDKNAPLMVPLNDSSVVNPPPKR